VTEQNDEIVVVGDAGEPVLLAIIPKDAYKLYQALLLKIDAELAEQAMAEIEREGTTELVIVDGHVIWPEGVTACPGENPQK